MLYGLVMEFVMGFLMDGMPICFVVFLFVDETYPALGWPGILQGIQLQQINLIVL